MSFSAMSERRAPHFNRVLRFGPIEVPLDRLAVIFLTVCVSLLLNIFWETDFGAERGERTWWILWATRRLVSYVALPVAVMVLVLKEPIRSLGLARPSASDVRLYGLLLAVLMPLVIAVSYLGDFQDRYPFFEPDGLGDIWVWWVFYALQFAGLEFFYRGFMIHTLKSEIGAMGAVWAMVVPYMMIHGNKPVLEAIGSIIAGVVLGVLSVKKNSIWGGVVMHVSVALVMDILVMSHRGLF